MPLTLPPCAQAVQVSVTDRRQNPAVIGQRFEENTPAVQYPIQMVGDAATYVRDALTFRLKQAGAAAPDTSQESLSVELRQLLIDEKIYYNSEYNAVTSFQAVVVSPGSPQPCWQGLVSATASNYGKSANAVNYQETLDRVMDAAAAELVKASGFADALCGKCTPVPH